MAYLSRKMGASRLCRVVKPSSQALSRNMFHLDSATIEITDRSSLETNEHNTKHNGIHMLSPASSFPSSQYHLHAREGSIAGGRDLG